MREFFYQNVDYPLKGPFRISRGVKVEARLVRVKIKEGSKTGEGECCPYPRYGESQETVGRELFKIRTEIENGAAIKDLQNLMPPGAARNAVDCALYDLEAKISGTPVHERLGLPKPGPFRTFRTISIDTPEAMAKEAKSYAKGTPLKVKLDRKQIRRRLEAIRKAAPKSKIMVDANEDWTAGFLEKAMPVLKGFDVVLIEQPLPADKDEALKNMTRDVPVLADEACHSMKDLENLAGKYDALNIKLDKTGGLTGALRLLKGAKDKNLKIMLGCMVSSSLSIAPMALLCCHADFIDLDAPLFLKDGLDEGMEVLPGSGEVKIKRGWGNP